MHGLHHGQHRCSCGMRHNAYHFPRPQPKQMRFLDTVMIEKFTVNRVGENCVRECEPVHAGVSIKNSCLILTAATNCLEPDVFYTFDIARNIPINWNALQVFIRAEPCGFFRGAIELQETEVTVPLGHNPHFKFTEENLPRFYAAKERHDEECECHRIPRQEVFIEVDLDLRGNMVTTSDFMRRHHFGNPCSPEHHRFVLYRNNSGRLILTRTHCETRRFGDFV